MDQKVLDALTAWKEVYDEIDKYEPILTPLVAAELKLRKELIAVLYVDGAEKHEGTENHDVWPGWKLKAIVKIDRKVDEAALPAIREQLQKMLINPDPYFRVKHEVNVKEYRKLPEEAMKVVDQALTIKQSTPSIDLYEVEEKS